jgi:hypothetical protein
MKRKNLIDCISKSNISDKEKKEIIEIVSNKKFSTKDIIFYFLKFLSISNDILKLFDIDS